MPRHNKHEKKKGKKTPSVLSFENSFKKKFHRIVISFLRYMFGLVSIDRSITNRSNTNIHHLSQRFVHLLRPYRNLNYNSRLYKAAAHKRRESA